MLEMSKAKITGITAIIIIAFGLLFLRCPLMNDAEENNVFNPNQTSASLLIKFAQKRIDTLKTLPDATEREAEEQRLVIMYDLYIKARSYAITNKVFFWISILSAIAVLLWPSLSVILQANNYEWLKSAVVQTTVTGIAALAFAFYSQYKDKQTYAENLMRYVLFSKEDTANISEKVIERPMHNLPVT